MKIKDSLELQQQAAVQSEIDKANSGDVFCNIDPFAKLVAQLFVELDLQNEADSEKWCNGG
jgi:hypothetical protein